MCVRHTENVYVSAEIRTSIGYDEPRNMVDGRILHIRKFPLTEIYMHVCGNDHSFFQQ
jgi:hypothetical protein